MYVPIVCVYFCERETERNNTSTTLFCNLFGEWLGSWRRIYQKLLLTPSMPWISSNEWLPGRYIYIYIYIYIVLFLTRLVFLLFPMVCNKMHPNSVNLREDLGLIQDICMPEQTSILAWEGGRSQKAGLRICFLLDPILLERTNHQNQHS